MDCKILFLDLCYYVNKPTKQSDVSPCIKTLPDGGPRADPAVAPRRRVRPGEPDQVRGHRAHLLPPPPLRPGDRGRQRRLGHVPHHQVRQGYAMQYP